MVSSTSSWEPHPRAGAQRSRGQQRLRSAARAGAGALLAAATVTTTVAATVTATGTAAAAATPAAWAVSLAASPGTAGTGSVYTLTGSVSPAAVGATVQVQRYYSSAWHAYANVRLDAHSHYTLRKTAPSAPVTLTFRTVKPAGAGRATGASATRRVYVVSTRYAVAIATPARVEPSAPLTVSGSVSPAAAGAAVTLQRLDGSSWRTVATKVLDSSSRYTFPQTAAASFGTLSYRVVKAASTTALAGTSRTAQTPVTSTTLKAGQRLTSGTFLQNTSGQYRLVMQGDGNLVEYVRPYSRPIWSAGTAGHAGAFAQQQGDGNLVVYDAASSPLWQSGTGGHADDSGWFTALQPDANLVVYLGGTPAWANSAANTELDQGETLLPGEDLTSPDGHFHLTLGTDGNVAEQVAGSGRVLWQTSTAGHPHARLVQQTDGNVVLYDGTAVLWNAATGGSSPSLRLQNDANLVQYVNSGAAWHNGALDDRLNPGETLTGGQSLQSAPSGAFALVMQGDGNLVQYSNGTATWNSGTEGHPGAFVVMQGDGNLVIYAGGTAMWNSATSGSGNMVVNQDDGNIVVYGASGALWNSHAAGGGSVTDGGDTYPDKDAVDCSAKYGVYSWCKGGTDMSPRGFAYRNCTDWVSFKIGKNWSDIKFPNGDGNARGWKQGAINSGYTVSNTPRVGAVAWWGTEVGGGYGHVAWVASVNSDGTSNLEEYNYAGQGEYHTRTHVRPDAYLYIGV